MDTGVHNSHVRVNHIIWPFFPYSLWSWSLWLGWDDWRVLVRVILLSFKEYYIFVTGVFRLIELRKSIMEGWFKLLPPDQAHTQNIPIIYSKRTDGKIDMESGHLNKINDDWNLVILKGLHLAKKWLSVITNSISNLVTKSTWPILKWVSKQLQLNLTKKTKKMFNISWLKKG